MRTNSRERRPGLVHVSDFIIPKDERDGYDEAMLLGHAQAEAAFLLRHVIWDAVMDEGPRAVDTLELVRTLSRRDWLEEPRQAVADLAVLMDRWEKQSRPIWAKFGRALEIFAKYEVARAKIHTLCIEQAA